VRRLFHFGITGEYDWQGVTYREDPDPYGRWIMGGNYLTAIPGYEGFGATARALHRLAIAAGQAGIYAADAHFDPLKLELRATLSAEEQDVYDLFAPLTTETLKDTARATQLAQDLAAAAVRTDPMFDPAPYFPRVAARTFVAHGRDDRLVPFTEAYRVAAALPPHVLRKAVITSLFAHSGGTRHELDRLGLLREGARFVALLHGILDLV
jgi:pimeloyl-ACP methyl ester carboxylesterase